jgi:hypothetical protein
MMHVSVLPNGWLQQHSYRIVWRLSWLDETSGGVGWCLLAGSSHLGQRDIYAMDVRPLCEPNDLQEVDESLGYTEREIDIPWSSR